MFKFKALKSPAHGKELNFSNSYVLTISNIIITPLALIENFVYGRKAD